MGRRARESGEDRENGTTPIHVKWESLDGRRVRVWAVLPVRADAWPDAEARPPLLLLHGLSCSVRVWKPALLEMARRGPERPVYAVDMPGFGRSGGPRRVPSVARLADWVARLLDLLGVERAHVAGNSLGCQVALALARRHPGRAASLILAGPTPGGDLMTLGQMARGLARDAVMEPALFDGTIARMYLEAGPRRFANGIARMRADHPVRDAGAVRAPWLILRGDRDSVVPESAARALADALASSHPEESEYRTVAGSPHAVQYAAPEAFTDLALGFLRRVETSAAAGG